jgi:chemotaxis protein methyltransferase CheR
MEAVGYKDLFNEVLSEMDFYRISRLIQNECGIKMPAPKKVMLEARLRKRLRFLQINSYAEYCDYLFSPKGITNELVHMLDVVTTNKTDFFREPEHFDYLYSTALPELVNAHGAGTRRKLMAWSAGCSSGEEPYTLAMILDKFADRCDGFQYSILATDISTKVLEKAYFGIYPQEKVLPVPFELKKQYLLRSKDKTKRLIRVAPEIRARVTFQRLNLMDEDSGIHEKMDVLFFRNVIIYFNKSTQKVILNRICRHLRPAGYLFTGHSETLHGLDLPLRQVASSIYRKQG